MSKQIFIIHGRSFGTTQRIRAWLALLEREANLALFGNAEGVADLPVLGASEAAGYEDLEDYEVIPPGFAFAQWFALHDIPSIVARYAK